MKTHLEETRESFPKYTVYICRDTEGVIVSVQPFDVYANYERTYEQCKTKLENKPKTEGSFSWEERQDKDLYEIACILRTTLISKKTQNRVIDRLKQVAFDIDELCAELETDELEVEE